MSFLAIFKWKLTLYLTTSAPSKSGALLFPIKFSPCSFVDDYRTVSSISSQYRGSENVKAAIRTELTRFMSNVLTHCTKYGIFQKALIGLMHTGAGDL